MRKLLLAALAGTLLLLVPSAARATASSPMSTCRCAKIVFARHFPHRSFKRSGRHQKRPVRRQIPRIDRRIRRYARFQGTKLAFEGCNSSPLVRKACDAVKLCIAAGAGVFYAEVLNGADGYRAERDGLIACQGAIIASIFGGS